MEGTFAPIRFGGELRPNQKRAIKLIKARLADGERRVHVVAPPGSGKTVLGLYVWARLIRRPALVLSPTSAIQSQWISRAEMFGLTSGLVSDDASRPGLLTSLTYQSLTLPKRRDDDLDAGAREAWMERLVSEQHAATPEEALSWIEQLRTSNPDYYARRLAAYRKSVTEDMTRSGRSADVLHRSSREALDCLAATGIGLIILDECHHLLGHWGRVLSDAEGILNGPIVLALTATAPDEGDCRPEDFARYRGFVGPVSFEVPTPAVVKEGHLSPYQDLVYFVRPTARELDFIASADRAVHELVESIAHDPEGEGRCAGLTRWLAEALRDRRLATGSAKTWRAFVKRDAALADSGRLFLMSRGVPMPEGVPREEASLRARELPEEHVVMTVLDRYVRNGLRRSSSREDHALAERIVQQLRLLGAQITETGMRACASPVSRVLAYSAAKAEALVMIMRREHEVLGDRIRAVVVTDYETTSADLGSAADVLSAEAGGAVAAFRALLTNETDALDPVLVTGSTVLVDDDLVERFLERARAWLGARGLDVTLRMDHRDGFARVMGSGESWTPRTYVALITSLFQEGVTRCLVGTRGLLGEGWDASRINVLVDLTTVTTSMSVNQLRGRSIRLDPDDPKKVADNWDVICIADEFVKGLGDYERFRDRHAKWYGVTEDGQVEKGVGKVHAAFTEAGPEHISTLWRAINDEMLSRAERREDARRRWKIGEPFHNTRTEGIEISGIGAAGFPPFRGAFVPWSDASLTQAVARAVVGALREAGIVGMEGEARAKRRAGSEPSVNERSTGYVRVMWPGATRQESRVFLESVAEALGPLDQPRYVISRQVTEREHTLVSRLLPSVLSRYFQRTRRRLAMLHAVPSALARNRALAGIFERHWNEHVSPGRVMYAHRGEGEAAVERARAEGLTPGGSWHGTEVFG